MTAGDILSLVLTFGGFILILVLAWWSVKLLSRGVGAQGGQGRNIRIVERIGISTDKQLLIVKAADRAFLIGVSAQHIEKIEELDPDSLNEPKAQSEARDGAFMDLLKNTMNLKKDKETGKEEGERR